MARFHHGCAFSESEVAAEAAAGSTTTGHVLTAADQPAAEQSRFGFLFQELQKNNSALLTEDGITIDNLIALGEAMADTSKDTALNNSTLPAVFTYFGQFIDHDIAWEKGTKDITEVSEIKPWDPEQVKAIVNKRTGSLDLDCVYGDSTFEVPLDADGNLALDFIGSSSSIPPNKGFKNDVPRTKPSNSPLTDRVARIGDPRNDENTIISQLHVAFLHAHNKLMRNHSFANARSELVKLYQTIVVEDYLTRIIRPDVFKQVRDDPKLFHDGSCMPVEFSAAAFRFGHTMIRTSYALNRNFDEEDERLGLAMLFEMPPSTYPNLPGSWIIEWPFFLDGSLNLARQINTRMVEPLSLLKDSPNNPFKKFPRLAVRDLLRGYIFRLPTGQSIAREIVAKGIGVSEAEIITGNQFENLVPPAQWEVLTNSEFHEKTPLWFYILAEAAKQKKEDPNHDYLGPVGSYIVASVFMGLLSKSKDSILHHGNSNVGSRLSDLFRLGGVL